MMVSSTAATPLLQEKQQQQQQQQHGRAKEERGGEWWRRVIDVEEAKAQLLFAFPMILTSMSVYAVCLVSVMFAGHLGDLELAGATLGNSWSTVTGNALLIGLSGALETLCGQAFGAKSYRMTGVYLQSSLMISTFFSVIISIVWYYSETILVWLHQEPEVSKYAALYLIYMVPGLFALGAQQCLQRFLQTQSIVGPLVVCSVVPLVLHIGITYLMVHVLGLGFRGASISVSITMWISLLMLVFYVKYSEKLKHTWQGFSMESLQTLIPSMKLALPSAVMVCLEFCAFEILVLLAGLLPRSEYSTSLVAMCVNTEAIAYNITFGFSAVASTRVSNEIGAGNIEKAKTAVSVTLKLSIFLALGIVLLLVFGHNIWASLFSGSNDIIQGFAYMTPLLMVSIVLDSAQGVLSGVSRGCGWQHLAALTNLVAFYAIGMPLAVLFGFKLALHDKGLWLGLICGLFCQAWTLLVISLRTKWAKLELSVSDGQNYMTA